MATLTKDKPRVFVTGPNVVYNEIPIVASDTVYLGAAVSISSGNARPLNTSDEFAGFCIEQCANESGSAGDKKVKVLAEGIVKLSVTGASAVTHINDAVYATDDDTFTLTASGGLQIGKVHRWITGTTCEVRFEALGARSV